MLSGKEPHTNRMNGFFNRIGCASLWQNRLAGIVIAPLLLAGCNSKREAAVQPPTIAVPAPGNPEVRVVERHHTTIIPRSPLRRSGDTLAGLHERDSALQAANVSSPLVTSSATDSGILIIKALGVGSESQAMKLLESSGFKAEGDGAVWSRRLNAAERKALEAKLAKSLNENLGGENALRARLQKARTPGTLLSAGGEGGNAKWLPGKVVYTGHALDIAFADAGADPHHFLAVDAAGNGPGGFIRGGRLYISEDGALKIGNSRAAGEWRPIPQGTVQVVVQADGKVLALNSEGAVTELGRLRIQRLEKFVAAGDGFAPAPGETPAAAGAAEPLRPGHLEFPAINLADEAQALGQIVAVRRLMENLCSALSHPIPPPPQQPGAAPVSSEEPLIIHADLALTEQHLKALGIAVERTPGRTTIALNGDLASVSGALAKTLQVLRLRMSVHEQNLRNADKIRDADNLINPYRRKLIKISPQGEAVEEADPAPFPKTYKPGDPNADGEGFVIMPNVNRGVETAEFQAAAAEYKLVRAALERLSPHQIFPDPIALPQKADGQ